MAGKLYPQSRLEARQANHDKWQGLPAEPRKQRAAIRMWCAPTLRCRAAHSWGFRFSETPKSQTRDHPSSRSPFLKGMANNSNGLWSTQPRRKDCDFSTNNLYAGGGSRRFALSRS